MANTSSNNNYAHLFSGVDAEIPLLDGSLKRYVNLDNAASTPPMKVVQHTVNNFFTYYSSVHRGTGFKSQLSTHAYEVARETVIRFVGANPKTHSCIFGKNTTEAINKLARRFPFSEARDVVLTSAMEHHSNDLPWRASANTIHIGLTQGGQLNLEEFESKLKQFADRVALVAITGASNVTGFINPIYYLAERAHSVGAQIVVDCAQMAPHRKVDMLSLDDPKHLDYVTISAHKMYAPLGTGALIGRRGTFERGEPDLTGGGTVEIVTLDDVVWTNPPDRDEAGSPNTVGAVALAAAIKQLEAIGMDTVAEHEAELTAYALDKLSTIPKLKMFGDTDPNNASNRLGVVPMEIEGISHFLVAAILGYEFGVGVRSGCFCAHPYILHLLGLTPSEVTAARTSMLEGDKSDMPGLLRASFGLYNTLEDVDILLEALSRISNNEYKGEYIQDSATGEYTPKGWHPTYEDFFSFYEMEQ
jgi:selenocysteine lyase/cysteine desulfurase